MLRCHKGSCSREKSKRIHAGVFVEVDNKGKTFSGIQKKQAKKKKSICGRKVWAQNSCDQKKMAITISQNAFDVFKLLILFDQNSQTKDNLFIKNKK